VYRRINDLEIYCEIIGDGTPVVMVHGMGVDHRTMKGCIEPVFRDRDDRWQRIYFDLPGMGKTAGVDWITDSDGMLAFVLAFIAELVPQGPFLLVGESYGCSLARGWSARGPKSWQGCCSSVPWLWWTTTKEMCHPGRCW
jgi:pimeloyl-ACP methyl ester carboxylesterase